MTKPATDKQIAYIADLTEQAIGRYRSGTPDRRQVAVLVAMILTLPAPTTMAEASEIIDALKGSPANYWRSRPDVIQPVLDKLGVAFGRDMAAAPAARPLALHPNYVATIKAAIA